MSKKQSIISILIGFTICKVIIYFVNKARFRKRFRKDMEDVKNQVFNDPFYKKQREEMGL